MYVFLPKSGNVTTVLPNRNAQFCALRFKMAIYIPQFLILFDWSISLAHPTLFIYFFCIRFVE